MRQLNFYTQKAINRYNLNGQNALAREIGIAGATLSQFLNGKALPSEETMIKLAELAGLPKEEALIDLNLWRSKDKPELQKIWQRLSKMIGCFLIVFMVSLVCAKGCFATENLAPTLNDSPDKIHIMRQFYARQKGLLLYYLCIFR